MKNIQNYLSQNFLEREEIINGLLVSIIAQENILLLGDPGTAKSLLVFELFKSIYGINYFQWLMTKFTTPEEIFGALSLKDLENGSYRRITKGKLPAAHGAFLDEIFKASSASLNLILTIINEKLFYNDGQIENCPLWTLVGASNEHPECVLFPYNA